MLGPYAVPSCSLNAKFVAAETSSLDAKFVAVENFNVN